MTKIKQWKSNKKKLYLVVLLQFLSLERDYESKKGK